MNSVLISNEHRPIIQCSPSNYPMSLSFCPMMTVQLSNVAVQLSNVTVLLSYDRRPFIQ